MTRRTPDGGTVWLAPWEPSVHLRAVRHQVNNLLAPVVVAAELLDDGSQTASLLTRSVARLRDVSNRTGELLRLGAPSLREITVRELASGLCLPAPSHGGDRVLLADPERLYANVCVELAELPSERGTEPADLRAGASCTLVTGTPDAPGTGMLRLGFVLPEWVVVEEPHSIAVPFALSGVDVRLALACRETVLQGGCVGFEPASRTLGFHLPLR